MSEDKGTTEEVVDVEFEDDEDTGMIVHGAPPVNLATTASQISGAIEAVNKMKEFGKVVRNTALGQTRPVDWREWNGRLRMESSGALSIAATFGMSHSKPRMKKKSNADGGYTYYCEARYVFPLSGASISAIGSCNWNDDIVATRYSWEGGSRKKIELTPSEVDESVVMKKALANCHVNGITSLLGLKNVTKEELKSLGIVVAGGGGVSHSNKAWEMSDGQRSMLEKFKCTDAEINACKSNADVTELMNKRKAEPRGSRGGGGKKDKPPAESAPAEQERTDVEANQSQVNNLVKMAQKAEVTWDEVEDWRSVCFSKGEGAPWMLTEVVHCQKWLADPCPPEEYKETMG